MASKTPLGTNQSFKIDALGGDVTQVESDPQVADGEVAVWIGNGVDLGKRVSLIETIEVLERFALARIDTANAGYRAPQGGTEANVDVAALPGTAGVALLIGTGTARRSHLFSVAVHRLKETIREATAGN